MFAFCIQEGVFLYLLLENITILNFYPHFIICFRKSRNRKLSKLHLRSQTMILDRIRIDFFLIFSFGYSVLFIKGATTLQYYNTMC